MTALAILDLGYGNMDSIRLAFARLGIEAVLTADADEAEHAERLVLPGVGAAGFAMRRLADGGLIEPLRRRTGPILGVCLGMQILFDHSEEADTACLGLVPGRVRALKPAPGRPVPHMGWTSIARANAGIGIDVGDYVYFAHGFACDDGPATAASVSYGETLPAVIRQDNLWGAQFHPERSSAAGARFLSAFLDS